MTETIESVKTGDNCIIFLFSVKIRSVYGIMDVLQDEQMFSALGKL